MSTPTVALPASPPASEAAVRPTAAARLLFVDNIRVFLTVLVIVHHLMVIYAGSGSWIYPEGRQDEISAALGGWFCATNQAYFMGLFLFISAYFVPGSYERKGAWRFLKDRLVRLGIPLVLYGLVIRPVWIYLGFSKAWEISGTFLRWYGESYIRENGIIGGGPLWFIETLLIFSAVYAVWRVLARSRARAGEVKAGFPSLAAMAAFAVLLGIATFGVRLVFPSGSSFKPLNLQLANFAQYIALFVLGLLAYRRDWLRTLPAATGRVALWSGIALVILYPVLAVFAGAVNDSEPFMGGWHWQALLYATWEAFVCVALCAGLIYLFRTRWNSQGAFGQLLSRHAYAAYLIHEPVITLLALAAGSIALFALLKFALAALIFVPIAFALSVLVLKIPGADRVL